MSRLTKPEFESKSLVTIVLAGYVCNLLCGWSGYLISGNFELTVLLYQVGNAFAISASVMAGRYTGLRGEHVAASAYILLGITHGISLAALGRAGINAEREATMAMPMIPALLFIFWCSLFPRWLRAIALIPSALFAAVYIDVQTGNPHLGPALYWGYATLQIIEVIWGVYLYKDWKDRAAARP